jgi:hypothetical protein
MLRLWCHSCDLGLEAGATFLSFKGMGLLSAPALYLLPFLFTILTSITHGTSSRATSPWPSVRCSSSAGTLAIVAPG